MMNEEKEMAQILKMESTWVRIPKFMAILVLMFTMLGFFLATGYLITEEIKDKIYNAYGVQRVVPQSGN